MIGITLPRRIRRWIQKSMWKLVYGVASRGAADPRTAFMNYGYAPVEPDGSSGGAIANGDHDRFGIELYHRVASGSDLAARDVLDIGCGRGGGAAFVFDRHRPRSLVGLDLVRSAIAHCRAEHERPGLAFVQGDAEALPFADATFDAVINIESSHCYPDVPQFLEEVHRVLRPGGSLLFADLRHTDLAARGDDTVMPQSDVGRLLAQLDRSPFTLVEQEDITRNVLSALRLDSGRRRRLIHERVPKLLQPRALAFAAVEGTPLYQGFVDGDVTYLRFVLHKTASAVGASRHMQAADDYVRKGRKRVPGWFELDDAVLFQVFNRMQLGASVSGDLLEIGVYQGKSAILMGYFPQPGEELVVCDLFGAEADSVANEKENESQYPRLSERKFAQHYQRHHARLPRVLKQSSLEIEPQLEGRRFRFIHIDGSHLYSTVRNDIDLARRHATEDAVMVLDDIASAHTPGVTAAGWEEVTQSNFTPLCVTKHKLYGTWSRDGALNPDAVRRALAETRLRVYELDFRDSHLLRVAPGGEAGLLARVAAPLRPPAWEFVAARIQSFR